MCVKRCPWLMLACCGALLACGGQSSRATDADANAIGGSASSVADAGSLESGGGSGSTAGYSGNGGNGGNGGNPASALGGTAGSIAADAVALCLYPDQLPDSWSPATAGDAGDLSCAVGQRGQFLFEGCRYELLDATSFDVDPFTGGHSHCCYLSKLLGCT